MSVTAETLQQRLDRLERERLDADRRYNDALTALDRSLGPPLTLPPPPPPADVARMADLNRDWDVLPSGAPPVDSSIKGRLRAFVWRMIGPPLETQRRFNAALVDHLNRNVSVDGQREKTTAAIIAACADQAAALVRFQSHLLHYLQTITSYVDTRSRGAIAGTQVLSRGLDAVSDEFQRRWESQSVRDARQAAAFDAMRASVDDLRATATLAQQSAVSLKREVERLVAGLPAGSGDETGAAAPATTADLNSFKYLGFENEFRGSVGEIRRRLEAYLPLFAGQTDVIDIGCGRGEFLDLLRGQGISARGIDINSAMVEEAQARGLVADRADALAYLSSVPDGSLGGVFAAQVIEHLPSDYLTALIEAAAQKLRPGGLLVFETINPTCWLAFFESYIRDLTHVRPLHPDTLQYLLRVSGFSQVRVQYSAPVTEAGRLRPLALDPLAIDDPVVRHVAETVNGNVHLLNTRLFGYQDYAVIGTK